MPNHRPAYRSLHHAVTAVVAAVSLGCGPAAMTVPAGGVPVAGSPTLTLPRLNLEAARQRLSGTTIDDFTLSLLGARKHPKKPELQTPSRTLQAYGDAANAAWNGGVALSALGCAATDLATNGVAVRQISSQLPYRLFAITREGKFLDLDPAAPATGAITTTVGGTFTKTFVTLAGDGKAAFVVDDAGTVTAIDLENVVAGVHPTKTVSLGSACVGSAVFADPLTSDTQSFDTVLYCVTNTGAAYRTSFLRGATNAFTDATLGATGLGQATAITSALSGAELVKAPCLALGGIIYVGDRRGNLNILNTNTSTLTSHRLNPGWPVETSPAVDVDNDLNVTDVFVPCGAQLFWVKPSTGAVYPGHYAVVENKGGTSGRINASSGAAGTFLNVNTTSVSSDTTYRVSTLFKHPISDAVVLPGQTTAIDADRLTHSEFVTGQPPGIEAYIGPAGRSYPSYTQWTFGATPTTKTGAGISPPVADGTPLASAELQGPVGIEIMDDGTTFPADDGSLFIGDSDHCQVLFKPAFANSGQKWASSGPLAGTLDPGKVYIFAGTTNGDGVWNSGDIGNGAGGTIQTRPTRLAVPGQVARGTPINLIFGMAIGNLGLYIGLLNKAGTGSYKDGAVMFVPRVGVTSAFGMTGLVAGQMYVLTTAFNPQGLAVDRYLPGRDILYASSFDWGGSANQNKIMTMDSSLATDATVFAAGLLRPVDVCLDDQGNLFTAESTGSRVSMFWDTRGLGMLNTRTWGVAAPVANTRYDIRTGLSEPQTVSFALADPQVPDGCLYIGSTGNHTIVRVDQSGAPGKAAGLGSAGDTGDGGPAVSAKLNFPHRAKGDGKGTTYVADRFNNRIRILKSPPDAGVAQGYARFNATVFLNRAIYEAKLLLTSRSASGTFTMPVIGVADPYLNNGTPFQLWTHTNLVPTRAPAIDLTNGLATPASGSDTFAVGTTHSWTLPANAIPTAVSGEGATVRIGMVSPTDSKLYYYPVGIGLPSGASKGPEFYSHTTATAVDRPTITVKHGTVQIRRGVLSPPAIEYNGASRYVYLSNANALFRYDTTSTANFTGSTSFVDFTLSAIGRATGNGTLYNPTVAFQPNPTPPLVSENGRVHIMDIRAVTATSYNYGLTAFNGVSGTSDMGNLQSKAIAAAVTSTFDDNAGIYMASGNYTVDETFFGLGNHKLYRVTLLP